MNVPALSLEVDMDASGVHNTAPPGKVNNE